MTSFVHRSPSRPQAPTGLNRRILPAWLARWARRFLALPVALGLTNAGQAQTPNPAGPAASRIVINKTSITLPILLDNSIRPQLKEVQLHVKENPTAPWVLKERVPPTQQFFVFRAPGDGEYSFSVVTVDRMGRTVPADVNAEPPALTVVVDTTGPNLHLHLLENTKEGQLILVEGQDPNFDPARTKLFYQTGDKAWRPLECLPGSPDQFCIPAVAVLTGMVKVQGSDKAGNTTSRDFNVNALRPPGVGTPVVSGSTGSLPVESAPGAIPPLPKSPGVLVEVGGSKLPLTPPPTGKEIVLPPPPIRPETTKVETTPTLTPPPLVITDVPKESGPITTTGYRVETPPGLPGPALDSDPVRPGKGISVEVPPREDRDKGITLPSKLDMRDVPREPAPRDPGPLDLGPKDVVPSHLNMVNNTRVFLDYQIESLGASGVGRVEIWLTRDKGQTWNKTGEDKDLKSPAEVVLPGEGVFGVSLVVTNGRGFGGSPPQPGDQADHWIEVDVTRPSGEILAVRPSGADDGSLFITWNARDKKLAGDPIDLHFSPTREGPWTSVAKGIKNDGSYRWVPPRDVATHAFLRMVIHDQAGNATTCETAHPVALDDLSRPRGRVLGISTTPKGALGLE